MQTSTDATVTPRELGEALAALLARHPGEEATVSPDGSGYLLYTEDEFVDLVAEAPVENT